jgi:hypothetical protein
VSSEWKLGDNVEWPVDVESEFLVESLGLVTLSFINIDNVPLLSFTSIVVPKINWCTFFILL